MKGVVSTVLFGTANTLSTAMLKKSTKIANAKTSCFSGVSTSCIHGGDEDASGISCTVSSTGCLWNCNAVQGSATDRNACVVFNQPDRRIDRVWNSPERYFPLLRQFACVTTPDFSLLLDMERQFIEYNLLRSLKMGRRMQELGMRVIVNAMWAFPDTYDICSEALPRNSVLFVSTVGSVLRRLARDYFKRGMKAMLERVRPSGIVLYGPVPPMDFAVPVLRHFDRLSPVRRGAYQPDQDLRGEGV